MYMSLVNQNKSNEVISAAESLEFCRVLTRTCTNLYGVSQRNKEDTRKRSFCLYFLYFLLFSFFKLIFLFCFSKVSNLKDMLAFYHLSHKLDCVFV